MSFLQGLFGPPNVEKLQAKGNVKGLIKALGYKKDEDVREAAAKALGEIGDARAVEPLIAASLQDKGSVGDVKYGFSGVSYRVRPAAAKALVSIGVPAVQPLIAALGDGDEDVRRAAAGALGQIGDPRAVEPLIAALRDKNSDVRRRAAEALGKLRDARAVDPLIAALKDQNMYACKAAAGALGQIGDPRAVEPLIAALSNENGDVRKAAAGALVKIGVPAVEPLIAVLRWDKDVRQAAAGALGQIGDARAVEPLITALKDKDKYVCLAAVKALGNLGWQPDQSEAGAVYWVEKRKWHKCVEIGAPAVEPLIAALNDRESVRKAAANTLGQIGDARAVEPLIAALKDEYWSVCQAAAGALVKIGVPAVEPLIAVLRWDKDVRQGQAAAGALGQIGDARAVEPLIAALKEEIRSVRRDAATALGQIGDARAVEPLIAALKDQDMYTCEAAAEALDNLGWQPHRSETGAVYWVAKRQWNRCVEIGTPAVKPLIAALKDKDNKRVRAAAAGALGQIGDRRAVEPLIAALKDQDMYTCEAAAEALDNLGWQPDKSETGATYWAAKVGPLIAALENEGVSVRRSAAEALVALYRGGKLDERSKQRILAMRTTMAQPHRSYKQLSDCTGHQDTGIGVTF